MKMIKISRHAKNNMRLYKISKDEIQNVIEKPQSLMQEGKKFIAISKLKGKFKERILKVVYVIENDTKIVITIYPLKKLKY